MITLQCGGAVEVARLRGLTTAQLRWRFTDAFGVQPRTNNRSYLFKRLALKVQELGRSGALKGTGKVEAQPEVVDRTRDPRLPQVGAILTKTYKGHDLKVLCSAEGFEFEGTRYRSLSAIARKITGTPWNGYLFFGLIPAEKAS